MKKVAVSKEERELEYFKFFEREMAPIPQGKIDILNAGPSRICAIPLEERNRFLLGEDGEYCQIGYGNMPDGTGFVCNETYMPDVTSQMLDWWFPWHSVGSDLRYKMWDPEDHYFARADNAEYVLDPRVPMNQKTWNVNHFIIEDIGTGPNPLLLHFKRPRDFGYDEAILGTPKCQSLVCAVGDGECAAAMTHKWYPYKDGVMFCSRFWIGVGYKSEGCIEKGIPDGVRIPVEMSRNLYTHNIKEFSNLASILPEVYEENRDNF